MLGWREQEAHVGSVNTSVNDIDVDTRSSRRIVGEDEIRLTAGEEDLAQERRRII